MCIYIYIYTCIYVYTNIYIYIEREREMTSRKSSSGGCTLSFASSACGMPRRAEDKPSGIKLTQWIVFWVICVRPRTCFAPEWPLSGGLASCSAGKAIQQHMPQLLGATAFLYGLVDLHLIRTL